MRLFHRFALASAAALAVIACSKPEEETPDNELPATVSPSVAFNLMDHTIFIDTLLRVESESYLIRGDAPVVSEEQGIDLHLEIVPIYAYGSNEYSGDYYAVNGYVVTHNGDLKVRKQSATYPDYRYSWITPYMNMLGMTAEILDKDGNTVSTGDVRFQTTPEPSTTVGSMTYNKGFTMSLNFNISFGAKKDDDGWVPSVFPSLLPKFNWSNSSTQNLPDQTVEMTTDGITRSVRYAIKTKQVETMNPDNVPNHAKTDQKVEFSWIWFVPKGRLSSIDYGTDAPKIRICITPEYIFSYHYEYYGGSSYEHDAYGVTLDCTTPAEKRTVTVEMGGLNRTPVGTLDFANATSNYVTGIKIVSKATGEELPVSGNYSRLKHMTMDLCEGEYSMYYTVKNGDTLKVIGNFVIDGIIIDGGSTIETSTLKGTKLQ